MLKVSVKNKSQNTIDVPLMSMVVGAAQVMEVAAPDGEASCVFLPPTTSAQVQDAIVSWAESAGIAVEISFVPVSPVDQVPSPSPPPGVIPNPMNPLGI